MQTTGKNLIVLLLVLFMAPLIYRSTGEVNIIQNAELGLFEFCAHMTQSYPQNPLVLALVYLNHKYEKILNIVIMLAITLALFVYYKDRRVMIGYNFLFLLVSLELYVALNDVIFFTLLKAARLSPSAMLGYTYITELYTSTYIKYGSYKSFPAGHAFAFFYWAIVTGLYTGKGMRWALLLLVGVFSMPRVFVGAHWLSDVVFSAYEAFVLVYFSVWLLRKFNAAKAISYQQD